MSVVGSPPPPPGMSRPHSLHIPPNFHAEDSAYSSQCTLRRTGSGGSDPCLWPARGRTGAAGAEASSDRRRGNKSEPVKICQPYHNRRRRHKEELEEDEEEEDDEEEEEEEGEEEEEDLWWLAGGSEEEESEEDHESLCSLPHRRSISSPKEEEPGCTRLRRALTSFSLKLLHTEKERPVQRILRPPRRRQTMRGLSGLPIEATNQWNATTAHEGY